jgi:hypothetical protein
VLDVQLPVPPDAAFAAASFASCCFCCPAPSLCLTNSASSSLLSLALQQQQQHQQQQLDECNRHEVAPQTLFATLAAAAASTASDIHPLQTFRQPTDRTQRRLAPPQGQQQLQSRAHVLAGRSTAQPAEQHTQPLLVHLLEHAWPEPECWQPAQPLLHFCTNRCNSTAISTPVTWHK